jgi:tRNA pseudouridine55 synthase
MRNRTTTPLIYKIFKPKGSSSFSVISTLKKEFPKSKDLKIGHFGTLDPFAEGLLLVGVYGATRLNQYLQKEFSKTYEAVGILGQKTTTGDLEGVIQEESFCENLKEYSLLDLKEILEEKFKGDYLQSPPSYSAAKHMGKSLYKYAQSGQIITKEPVLRCIHNLEILSFDFPCITFRATVGSGTYIRSLFEDMANTLGTVGHLRELKRTSIGEQKVTDSINPEAFGVSKEKGMRLDEVYPLAQVYLTHEEERKFCCGNNVKSDNVGLKQGDFLWVYNQEKSLMGMGEVKGAGLFPVWVFAQNAVS